MSICYVEHLHLRIHLWIAVAKISPFRVEEAWWWRLGHAPVGVAEGRRPMAEVALTAWWRLQALVLFGGSSSGGGGGDGVVTTSSSVAWRQLCRQCGCGDGFIGGRDLGSASLLRRRLNSFSTSVGVLLWDFYFFQDPLEGATVDSLKYEFTTCD
jgi:hypothetical protein